MNPVMFQIGPFAVRWYGFFMGLSMLFGALYVLRAARRRKLDEDQMANLIIIAVVAGLVGARLLYVLTNLPDYLAAPGEIIRIDQGGLSFHGGILGGGLAAWWYLRRIGVSFNRVADLFVPGIALGIALVRIGNLINGEVEGRITATGFQWPAQLIGSAIGAVLLIQALVLLGRNLPHGVVFWNFALWYSALRGIVEETVRDNPLYLVQVVSERYGLGFTTMTQLVTIPLVYAAWVGLKRAREAGTAVTSARPRRAREANRRG